MKSISEIYSEYNIMPALQMHQLRVAAVAKTICDNFAGNIDTDNVVKACLLHDMGNIIKSDLNYFPEFLEPQGLEYWQNVKGEFIEKYGNDEHIATLAIAKEVGLSKGAMECLAHIGFSHAIENEKGESLGHKICNYADMRVGPFGVIPMEERIFEGRKRYEGRKHSIASDTFDVSAAALRNIEKQIFERAHIRPDEINEEKVEGIITELKAISF